METLKDLREFLLLLHSEVATDLSNINNALSLFPMKSEVDGKIKAELMQILDFIRKLGNDEVDHRTNHITSLFKHKFINVLMELEKCCREGSATDRPNLIVDFFDTLCMLSDTGPAARSLIVGTFLESVMTQLCRSDSDITFKLDVLKNANALLEHCPGVVREMLINRDNVKAKLNNMVNEIRIVADYEVQVGIIEFLFRLIPRKLRSATITQLFHKPSISDAFKSITDIDFETDCRLFLNKLNSTLDPLSRVYSFACSKVIVGDTEQKKPSDKKYTDFWVDFNVGSERITVFCEQTIHITLSQTEELWETMSIWKDDINQFSMSADGSHLSLELELKAPSCMTMPTLCSQNNSHKVCIVFDRLLSAAVENAVNRTFSSMVNKPTKTSISTKPLKVHGQHISTPILYKMSVPCQPMSTPASTTSDRLARVATVRRNEVPPLSGASSASTLSDFCKSRPKSADPSQAPRTPTTKRSVSTSRVKTPLHIKTVTSHKLTPNKTTRDNVLTVTSTDNSKCSVSTSVSVLNKDSMTHVAPQDAPSYKQILESERFTQESRSKHADMFPQPTIGLGNTSTRPTDFNVTSYVNVTMDIDQSLYALKNPSETCQNNILMPMNINENVVLQKKHGSIESNTNVTDDGKAQKNHDLARGHLLDDKTYKRNQGRTLKAANKPPPASISEEKLSQFSENKPSYVRSSQRIRMKSQLQDSKNSLGSVYVEGSLVVADSQEFIKPLAENCLHKTRNATEDTVVTKVGEEKEESINVGEKVETTKVGLTKIEKKRVKNGVKQEIRSPKRGRTKSGKEVVHSVNIAEKDEAFKTSTTSVKGKDNRSIDKEFRPGKTNRNWQKNNVEPYKFNETSAVNDAVSYLIAGGDQSENDLQSEFVRDSMECRNVENNILSDDIDHRRNKVCNNLDIVSDNKQVKRNNNGRMTKSGTKTDKVDSELDGVAMNDGLVDSQMEFRSSQRVRSQSNKYGKRGHRKDHRKTSRYEQEKGDCHIKEENGLMSSVDHKEESRKIKAPSKNAANSQKCSSASRKSESSDIKRQSARKNLTQNTYSESKSSQRKKEQVVPNQDKDSEVDKRKRKEVNEESARTDHREVVLHQPYMSKNNEKKYKTPNWLTSRNVGLSKSGNKFDRNSDKFGHRSMSDKCTEKLSILSSQHGVLLHRSTDYQIMTHYVDSLEDLTQSQPTSIPGQTTADRSQLKPKVMGIFKSRNQMNVDSKTNEATVQVDSDPFAFKDDQSVILNAKVGKQGMGDVKRDGIMAGNGLDSEGAELNGEVGHDGDASMKEVCQVNKSRKTCHQISYSFDEFDDDQNHDDVAINDDVPYRISQDKHTSTEKLKLYAKGNTMGHSRKSPNSERKEFDSKLKLWKGRDDICSDNSIHVVVPEEIQNTNNLFKTSESKDFYDINDGWNMEEINDQSSADYVEESVRCKKMSNKVPMSGDRAKRKGFPGGNRKTYTSIDATKKNSNIPARSGGRVTPDCAVSSTSGEMTQGMDHSEKLTKNDEGGVSEEDNVQSKKRNSTKLSTVNDSDIGDIHVNKFKQICESIMSSSATKSMHPSFKTKEAVNDKDNDSDDGTMDEINISWQNTPDVNGDTRSELSWLIPKRKKPPPKVTYATKYRHFGDGAGAMMSHVSDHDASPCPSPAKTLRKSHYTKSSDKSLAVRQKSVSKRRPRKKALTTLKLITPSQPNFEEMDQEDLMCQTPKIGPFTKNQFAQSRDLEIPLGFDAIMTSEEERDEPDVVLPVYSGPHYTSYVPRITINGSTPNECDEGSRDDADDEMGDAIDDAMMTPLMQNEKTPTIAKSRKPLKSDTRTVQTTRKSSYKRARHLQRWSQMLHLNTSVMVKNDDEPISNHYELLGITQANQQSTVSTHELEDASSDNDISSHSHPSNNLAFLKSIGADLTTKMAKKQSELTSLTRAVMQNTQKYMTDAFTGLHHNRNLRLMEFNEKLMVELIELEKDVDVLRSAEEVCMTFYKKQLASLQSCRKSQTHRLMGLKSMYMELQASNQEMSEGECHNQLGRVELFQNKVQSVLKKELIGLQKNLLHQSQQQEIAHVRNCLRRLFLG